MIQHVVRRKLAGILPAAPEISIPLSAVVQTGISSVLLLTLRFSSVLLIGVLAAAAVRQQPLSVEVLVGMVAAAVSDRSCIVYLKVRRRTV
ncbi:MULTISPECIES: hypothetical protein [Streptomyces]|uniref:Uncharacterized protein n=1 Tax=Streptomyces nigrescens TaxID=1920 RepID=A0ABY7IX43_STRNI|nr:MULTISPECIES: hypothetical protein [Streptomyces]AWN24922.1 hypothetical protein DKG71_00940 [Streptomyces sp. NEAU-S7GS2]WAU02106.1 hypothetical protein STRNI_000061 [Streptomyces nigrescens]